MSLDYVIIQVHSSPQIDIHNDLNLAAGFIPRFVGQTFEKGMVYTLELTEGWESPIVRQLSLHHFESPNPEIHHDNLLLVIPTDIPPGPQHYRMAHALVSEMLEMVGGEIRGTFRSDRGVMVEVEGYHRQVFENLMPSTTRQ